MSDWIHCNNCFHPFNSSLKDQFHLTECFHVHCPKCFAMLLSDENRRCLKCRKANVRTVPIGNSMSEEAKVYFLPIGKLLHAIQFQTDNRTELFRHNERYVSKYNAAKQYATKQNGIINKLKNEVLKLINEKKGYRSLHSTPFTNNSPSINAGHPFETSASTITFPQNSHMSGISSQGLGSGYQGFAGIPGSSSGQRGFNFNPANARHGGYALPSQPGFQKRN